MSKSILVFDTPENCAGCPIRVSGALNEWCWYLKHGLDHIKAKPSWCPLKSLPDKIDQGYPCDKYDEGYGDGWDECIDEITGGEEE